MFRKWVTKVHKIGKGKRKKYKRRQVGVSTTEDDSNTTARTWTDRIMKVHKIGKGT